MIAIIRHPAVRGALRLILGGIFLASGAFKLLHLDQFLDALLQYKLVSGKLAGFMVLVLPALEAMTGLYLLAGWYVRPAAWACSAMLAMFIGAASIVMFRGQTVDCGCFIGGSSETVGWPLILRDAVMLAVALWLVWQPTRWPFAQTKTVLPVGTPDLAE